MSRDIAVIAGITALVLGLVFVVGPRLSAPAWSDEHMTGPILAPPQNLPAESPAPLQAPILTLRVVDQHSLARIDGAATVTMLDASGHFIDVQRGHADGEDIVFRSSQPTWPVRVTVRRPQYREAELGLIAAPTTLEAGLERLHSITLTADGSWRHVHLMRLDDHGREPFAMWTRWLDGHNVYELPQGHYHALFSDEADYFSYAEHRWLGETGDEATFEVGDGAASVQLTPERPVGRHSIQGSLHTNEGVALMRYTVTAVLLGPGPMRRVAARAHADYAGRFTLQGLAPGRYRVQPSAAVDPHGREAFADISVPGDAEATLTLAMTGSVPVPVLTRDGSFLAGPMPYLGFWKAGAAIAIAWPNQPPHRVWRWGDPAAEVWDGWFQFQFRHWSSATMTATQDNGSRTVAVAEFSWDSESAVWTPLITTKAEDGASLRVSGLRPGEQAEVYVDCLISTALLAKGEGAKESGVLVVDRIPPGKYSFTVTAPGYVSLEVEVELEAGQVFEVTLTRVAPVPFTRC